MRLKLLLMIPFLLLATGALGAPRDREPQEDVAIKAKVFTPGTLKIKKGDSVTWKNNDNADHTGDGVDVSFSAGKKKRTKTWQHNFKKAEKYSYSSHLNARRKGKFVVKKESEEPISKLKSHV